MAQRLAADAVLLLHLAFIVFAVGGAVLALRWRWMPLLHLPAAAWAVFIEASGGLCPLTTLEDALRSAAGQAGQGGSFVERTLLALIYPEGLTRELQWLLAGGVLALNLLLYGWVWRRRRVSAPA